MLDNLSLKTTHKLTETYTFATKLKIILNMFMFFNKTNKRLV